MLCRTLRSKTMISYKLKTFLPAALCSAFSLVLVRSNHVPGELDFSYDPTNEFGPQNWGKVDTASIGSSNQCDGEFNSPIDIIPLSKCSLKENYVYNNTGCDLSKMVFNINDHGVQANYPTDGSCVAPTIEIPTVSGTFAAAQFHIHAGSEHTLNGSSYDFELHVVHKLVVGSGDGSGPDNQKHTLAVLGMEIKKGGEQNKKFDKILKEWQRTAQDVLNSPICQGKVSGSTTSLDTTSSKVKIYNFLRNRDFYFYSGGLTTPPCSENVWWNLSTRPIVISNEQAQELLDLILGFRNPETCELATIADPTTKTTSRPVQALNGRTVHLYCKE